MAVDRREAALPTAPPAVGAGATAEDASAGAPLAQASLWRDAWYRYIRNRAAVAGALIFIIMVLYCLLIPGFWKIPGIWTSLKDYDPNEVNFAESYAGFSLDHPFSTDKFGRDLFARTAVGGQISIAIGFAATFFILLIGVFYGSIAGFVGGKLDNAKI
jgi:oligopeptide transport system permease protein